MEVLAATYVFATGAVIFGGIIVKLVSKVTGTTFSGEDLGD